MPVITEIKRQQKRSTCYSVFVDEKFSFSLEELELSASGLRTGLELSTEDISGWQSRSSAGKAYSSALRYLSYRRRSNLELRRYLISKDFDEEVIDLTLERVIEMGLIDDEAFADAWIADRLNMKPRSRSVLILELKQKGINSSVIDSALARVDPDTELKSLKKLIEKKKHRYDEQKLIGYLMTHGYRYGLIREAINLD